MWNELTQLSTSVFLYFNKAYKCVEQHTQYVVANVIACSSRSIHYFNTHAILRRAATLFGNVFEILIIATLPKKKKKNCDIFTFSVSKNVTITSRFGFFRLTVLSLKMFLVHNRFLIFLNLQKSTWRGFKFYKFPDFLGFGEEKNTIDTKNDCNLCGLRALVRFFTKTILFLL